MKPNLKAPSPSDVQYQMSYNKNKCIAMEIGPINLEQVTDVIKKLPDLLKSSYLKPGMSAVATPFSITTGVLHQLKIHVNISCSNISVYLLAYNLIHKSAYDNDDSKFNLPCQVVAICLLIIVKTFH